MKLSTLLLLLVGSVVGMATTFTLSPAISLGGSLFQLACWALAARDPFFDEGAPGDARAMDIAAFIVVASAVISTLRIFLP